ncbi:peptide-N-glycosidase F-related protein [Sphingobacterium sp. ML3W]|uniref:PNGase F N-terminal domain-containing protein n=1 Tax=Sphingobacterium sp. ML3W TaxID=1538644 RepID=UPI00249C2AFF|nr:PNGase F N-terminal domain-containing protein [Sphingobacterium sp. ML3W]WFA80140.1 peptide-N-glycosidase F-related protein [Sphingobacterium sp. ML3W]
MKKNILFVSILCLSLSSYAQKLTSYVIQYNQSFNGNTPANQNGVLVYANANETYVSSEKDIKGQLLPPYERVLVERSSGNTLLKIAKLKDGSLILTRDSLALSKQKFNPTNETKTILGYSCKKVETSINSNKIEVWYTDKLGVKGAPSELGQDLGLVLEVIRNGNTRIFATKVEKVKAIPEQLKLKGSEKRYDELSYKDLIWKNRFVQLPVFQKERIRFSDDTKSDSILRFANGTVIVKKVKIPKIKASDNVFVQLVEQSKGDAYDRTGSVFIIPANKAQSFLDGMKNGMSTLPKYENGNGKSYQGVVRTATFEPIVELMRFFTPFGVKQFNYLQLKDKVWQDSVLYRQDVSELAGMLSEQEVYVGAFIGNYDKNGHEVSVELTIHPGFEAGSEGNLKKTMSLFTTTNVMEMGGQEYGSMFDKDKGLTLSFRLDQDAKNVQLRYITTGHGGWGNGDEFVPKENRIFLNDTLLFKYTPWRNDCGSYRLSNPASGNFATGLSSSDLSRSNWCPGTVTPPIYIDLGDLKAGDYKLQVQISQGAPEGTSFSSWNVSGTLLFD